MKTHFETLSIKTIKSFEFVDITQNLQDCIHKSGVKQGFILVRSTHTTGAITCTEPDESIHRDAKRLLDKLMPVNWGYEHCFEGRENGRAHQAEMLGFGHATWAPIIDGHIRLGTWQKIYFVDLFWPMRRKIDVVVGE